MKDKLYYFLLGFVSMWLVAMVVIAYNPTPKTQLVCGGCGSPDWYTILAEGEEQ